MMVLAAAIAIGLRLLNYPMAPMLLGFILGSMMEENLRRALMISDGSLSFLWERPITLVILIISMIFLIAPLLGNTREWLRNRKALPNDGEM